MLQAKQPIEWLEAAIKIWGNLERLVESWKYLTTCYQSKIPIQFSRAVIKAFGNEHLEAVEIADLDRHGNPIQNQTEILEVDSLCLGYGFVPNIKLTQLAGCLHHYKDALGGWITNVDANMQTTVPGIYAAGETCGVGGANSAVIEGRIAGLAVANQLGHLDNKSFYRMHQSLRSSLRPKKRFAEALNTLSKPPSALKKFISDDTIICRCEDITAGEVRAAINKGFHELDALKTSTHVGQGPCQGRTCGPILREMIAHTVNRSTAEINTFKTRPPIKPIPVASLGQGYDK
jgi:NAD(P)H-nitrite reductase large subunit